MLIARVIVAMAWILGAGSLLLFGSFLWTGGAVGLEFNFTPLSALLWDAFLCIVFFVQHSVLIRRPVRNALRRAVPDHLYGVAYTYTSALALVLLVVLWQRVGGDLYSLHGVGAANHFGVGLRWCPVGNWFTGEIRRVRGECLLEPPSPAAGSAGASHREGSLWNRTPSLLCLCSCGPVGHAGSTCRPIAPERPIHRMDITRSESRRA